VVSVSAQAVPTPPSTEPPSGALTAPAVAPGVPAVLAALASSRRRSRGRGAVVAATLVVVLAGLGVTSLVVGSVPVSPAEVLAALLGSPGSSTFVVTGLRLPRFALGVVVGAALGLAGGLLQAVVRNPLASPDIVGLTGGASAAAVLAIASGAAGTAVDAAALAGALAAAAAVFLLSGRGVTGTRFVVVGVAVAFFANGVLSYALSRASLTEAQSAFFWLVGSIGTAPWQDVARVGVLVLAVGAGLVIGRHPLSILSLDDDTARAVGGHPVATRAAVILVASALAAVAVAVAGPIAFVAFVSGPVARRLRGSGSALGTAALVGAVVVVAADLVAQHAIPGPLQPPAGLVTGALGAPVLLWLLVRGEHRREATA
jgi:iron complex transport system permease protein